MSLRPGELEVAFLPEWLVHELAYSYVQVLDAFLEGSEKGERGVDVMARVAKAFVNTSRTTAIPAIRKYRERGF